MRCFTGHLHSTVISARGNYFSVRCMKSCVGASWIFVIFRVAMEYFAIAVILGWSNGGAVDLPHVMIVVSGQMSPQGTIISCLSVP